MNGSTFPPPLLPLPTSVLRKSNSPFLAPDLLYPRRNGGKDGRRAHGDGAPCTTSTDGATRYKSTLLDNLVKKSSCNYLRSSYLLVRSHLKNLLNLNSLSSPKIESVIRSETLSLSLARSAGLSSSSLFSHGKSWGQNEMKSSDLQSCRRDSIV